MSRTVFSGAGASVAEDEGALDALFEDEATTFEGPYGAAYEEAGR